MIYLVLTAAAAFLSAEPQPQWRSHFKFFYIPPHVTELDYPQDARANEVEGTSLLRLELSANGKVTSCTVLRTAGRPSMDAQACRIWRERAHFRVKEGVEFPVLVRAPVEWRLADPEPALEKAEAE